MAQVETVWYCSVTVMGVRVGIAAQGVIVARGSAMAAPAMKAAVATAGAEKRMVKQINE